MSDEPDFHGAKVALFIEDQLLVYRRDDRPDIPFPDMLDLPGGGREQGESGAQCVARGSGAVALFFVCHLPRSVLPGVVFGDEGQGWQIMPVAEFLASDRAVPHLQVRLQEYIKTRDLRH